MILVNGKSHEHMDILMTNEMNKTLNKHALSKLEWACICLPTTCVPVLCQFVWQRVKVYFYLATDTSIVLEALIFAELNCREVTTIISGMHVLPFNSFLSTVYCPAGSDTYVRPLIRTRKEDAIPSVVEWSTKNDGEINFNIVGCLLIVLFLQSGFSPVYPTFDMEFLGQALNSTFSCRWSREYATLSTKYPQVLKQTKPATASRKRGSTIESPHMVKKSLTKEQWLQKRKGVKL